MEDDEEDPDGLSTAEALEKLVKGIEELAEAEEKRRRPSRNLRNLFRESFAPSCMTALFPSTALLWGALEVVFLGISNENPVSVAVISFFLIFNLALSFWETFSRHDEIHKRVRFIIKRFREAQDNIKWDPKNYPHLHTPISASVILQWTLRDGKEVNLPWSLLVKDDIILVKPGQVAPGECVSLMDPKVKLKQGDMLHIKAEESKEMSPTPEFRKPVHPEKFLLLETPYLKVLETVLCDSGPKRPPNILFKYAHLFFVQIPCHALIPIFLAVTIIWNIARWYNDDFSLIEVDKKIYFWTEPVGVICPLLSLIFPLSWLMTNHGALAWVLSIFYSFRHVKMTEDPFDDTVEDPIKAVSPAHPISLNSMKSYFLSSLLGTGEFLSRTENLVHTLGSVTALCCTDKKGILSWPNTSAEKIFLLKTHDGEGGGGDDDDDGDISCEEAPKKVTAEILTITHDHRNPFKVEFDDPSWAKFMNFLKPVGLSILLNTCNISTEEKYTNFYNHLVCESFQKDNRDQVDMLPIVTRGCLCELARKIGFNNAKTTNRFRLSSQIQTFRHVKCNTKHDYRFARNLSLAKLKFPFPHMVSVLVQERATGAQQLFSQGTADIILDSCTDFWSGKDLEPLTEDVRKKILDFYQRASLSSYCTAFSYRPITFPLPWNNIKEYLQLPSHSLPFYWQYSESAECQDTEAIHTHISLGNASHKYSVGEIEHEFYIKTKNDALSCLEVECNQTFLGMIQLQYQACVDFVRLIDLLEKACIRFVHFSKENELRSRVFSEKMGMESGWNCHISLKNQDQNEQSPVVTFLTEPPSEIKSNKLNISTQLRASLPVYLNRPPWFLDFPKWQEGASVTDDNESNFEKGGDLSPQQQQQLQQQRQSSIPNSDSDPFEYDMSNRAQLPRGIENIRPHLENMDDVPLLVSLFTDCTPDTTKEMLVIMQEYGEVVCVMGSSANYQNIPVFLQADASLAIEPQYPQICQMVPVSVPPKKCPSPVQISRMLNSVCTSLSFTMDDEISIFHLILESRHFVLSFVNCMQFWLCSLLLLSSLQLFSVLLALPPFVSIEQILWLTLIFIPGLSLSLIGAKSDPNIMNISTGKNSISLDLKYALWCYGARFFPTLALLIFCHLLLVLNTKDSFPVQVLNLLASEVFLIVISLSFLFRSHQLWSKWPTKNPAWIKTVVFFMFIKIIYTTLTLTLTDENVPEATHVWILWCVGAVVVMFVNEGVKRQEIRINVRHQKRARLEFGTKLGINSPF